MEYTEQELEIIKGFDEFIDKFKDGEKLLLKEWDEKILSLNNTALSLYFAKLDGEHANEHADIVLASKDLDVIYELSEKYPKHLEYILNSHDVEYNFRIVKKIFECESKNVGYWWINNKKYEEPRDRITKHVESMSNSLESEKLLSFLEWYHEEIKRLKRTDLCGLIEFGKIMLSDSSKYINAIINNIAKSNDAEVLYQASKIQKLLIYDMKDLQINCNFKHNNILKDELLKTGNAEYIYNLARNVVRSESTLKKCIKKVAESKDLKYCYLLARDIKDVDISDLLDVIIESKNPEFNYLCLENIKVIDKVAHLKAIAESKDLEYNLKASLLGLENDTLNKMVVIESGDAKSNFELALKYPNDPLFDMYVEKIKASKNEKYISKLPELIPIAIENINSKIKQLVKEQISNK